MSFEKLRVYQAALELRREVDKLKPHLRPGFEYAFTHVSDAVDSLILNIGEGSDSAYPGRRANFYDIARNSAKEACAGLRSLDARKAFGTASVYRPIVLCLAIAKMFTSLIARTTETKT